MKFEDVQADVADRVRAIAGRDNQDILGLYLVRDLGLEGWDFIDLCEDIEQVYAISLRPFFEDGQPEVGWWIWKRRDARDATVAELAAEVFRLAALRKV